MAQEVSLSIKKQRAVRSLLITPNQTKAAEAAGVSRRTISRWLAEDDFLRSLKAAEASALEELTRTMAGNALKAIAVLLNIMADVNAPAMARVRAASSYLSLLMTIRTHFDLEERIQRLEEAQHGNKPKW